MPDHEGDGAALYSTRHPLNITEEMIRAGLRAGGIDLDETYDPRADTLRRIYTAMSDASPAEPDCEINEDALETAEAEFYLPDEVVEAFAIRCAKGNNGGEWATHYKEEQKEVWRKFVRDLANAVADTPFRLRLDSGGGLSLLNNGKE